MATGTAGTSARAYSQQMIHYLRKRILETGGQTTVYTVGTIPADSVIIKSISGVMVNVAATAATNKLMDIGPTSNDDLWGTDLSLGTVALVPLDEAVSMTVTVDTTIIATMALSGTAGTAGVFDVVIAYIPPEAT